MQIDEAKQRSGAGTPEHVREARDFAADAVDAVDTVTDWNTAGCCDDVRLVASHWMHRDLGGARQVR
jgi:hypothetical protein